MAKNVIIMVGDGMGWEMTRAAAIQKQVMEGATGNTLSDFYTEGVGEGLGFQTLEGYAIATTGTTYIDGSKNNSALRGNPLTRETAVAVVRDGYEVTNLENLFFDENGEFLSAEVVGFNLDADNNFIGVDADGNPLVDANGDAIAMIGSNAPILGIFDPRFDERPVFAENGNGELIPVGGLINAYDLSQGRDLPWEADENPDYPKNLYPDSANTATTLYGGVKTYNGSIGVDIYEEDIVGVGEAAREEGKSFGVVSSVPFSHATPAAAVSHVSHRNKNTLERGVENFEIVLDANGVPLHEDHGDSHEGDPVYQLQDGGTIQLSDEEFRALTPEQKSTLVRIEDDNILFQILNETQPEVIIGGGHPAGPGTRYIDNDSLEMLRNGETVYTFAERGENASANLAQIASGLNVNEGDKLFGLYGARGQGGNLPWMTANGDYSNTGFSSRLDSTRPLAEGETAEQFIATEIDANVTLAEMTSAALDVLGDDPDGFWLMIEGGDIDWSMHDNNLDNAIGTTLSFNNAYEVVNEWIMNNGGYEENLLIVTADHDHYLTLNENFPELLRTQGVEALTTAVDENGNAIIGADGNKVDNTDPDASGYFWGSNSDVKYGWAHHTQIPVPVYYQGDGSEFLDQSVGQGYEAYGFQVPGLPGLIDQVNIAEAMFSAFGLLPPAPLTLIPAGSAGNDNLDAAFGDNGFTGESQLLFTGSGMDMIDVSQAGSNSRIDTGSGDDTLFAGSNNRIILGDGDDKLFISTSGGGNRVTGGEGADQFWILTDEGAIPNNPNIISDFTSGEDVLGFLNSSLSLGSADFNYEQMGSDVIVSAFGQEIAKLLNTTAVDTDFVFA